MPSTMTPDLSKRMDPTGKSIFDLILEEHRMVETLSAEYHQSNDSQHRQHVANNLVKLLSMHAACEEMTLYPVMKSKLPNGPQLVAHALNEHLQVKRRLYELDNSLVGQSGYDDRLRACLADVQRHVGEEENDLLPSLRQACSEGEVAEMTEDWLRNKKIAPTRPHPDAPNEPPQNKIANAAATPLDMVRDAGRFSSA